jgi:glycosyltransferase involved in cell wall biosynthesis
MPDTQNNNLHILIMPSWYKAPETPVLGTFFEEQARALEKEGYKVGIIYPEYTPPGELFSSKSKERFDFYMDKGMPTFNIKTQAGIPKLRRLSYRQFSKSVNEVFEEYVKNFGKPDLIHAHSVFHAGIAGFQIAKLHKIPFIITEHLTAYLMGYINNKVDIEVAREIFEYADGSLIVSHNFRKDLEKTLNLPENTFTVIHNLVNELFFDSYTPKRYEKGETFEFFTNSFLLPRKNIRLIIDAIKILRDKGLSVNLTIGGDGPMNETLREYVKFLNLNDHIRFTGKLWREEVKTEIDKCHSFVLASQYETFGVVLIESLACGRPVVCTDSGGPRDFVHPEHGVIVKNHEAEDLAEGMLHVMNNYNQYDQKQLIAYCKEHFNEHKIAAEIMNLYQSVLSKRVVYS